MSAQPSMAPMCNRTKFQFRMRCLLVLVTAISIACGLLGRELQQAREEQRAYRKLRQLGAAGDDWIGWKELFLGPDYAPIVSITLPPTITIDAAMPHLRQLDNLEYLDLRGSPISDDDLRKLERELAHCHIEK